MRKRILRAFWARGHLDAQTPGHAHGDSFWVNAEVRIEAPYSAELERLLRYCTRPPFDRNRLKQRGIYLVRRCGKGHAEPQHSVEYSGELVLTPLWRINRITQLVPPPRTRRYRYYSVLVPNSPCVRRGRQWRRIGRWLR